jgi:hypothetical protein
MPRVGRDAFVEFAWFARMELLSNFAFLKHPPHISLNFRESFKTDRHFTGTRFRMEVHIVLSWFPGFRLKSGVTNRRLSLPEDARSFTSF